MISKSKDLLFVLIKRLDKAEKRNFKLYASRFNSKENKFVRLFDLIDAQVEYNEDALKKSWKELTSSKLANLKRNLYNQIMKSLRLLYSDREMDIQYNEQLDYAHILYSKGLYLESLKVLEKLKVKLKGSNRDILLLQTVEFQKMIELRHITRSRKVKNKMEDLIEESEKINAKVSRLSELATVNIGIQGLYIKQGHVRDDRDLYFTKQYFYSNLPDYNMKKVSFFEKVLVYQSFTWYHYMCLNFPYCYKNSKKWVELFRSKPHMIEMDAGLYLRGLHYLLTSIYYLGNLKEYDRYYEVLMEFEERYKKDFSVSTALLHFNYSMNARLNYHLLHKDYRKNTELEGVVNKELKKASFSMDPHRTMIFAYKIGWSYFLLGEYEEAKKRFSSIIQSTDKKLRADTICYTKVMMLLCYFEKGEYYTLQNQLPNLRKYLTSYNEMSVANNSILGYIGYCSKNSVGKDERKLGELEENLKKAQGDRYERRSFIYFNYLDWVESQKGK